MIYKKLEPNKYRPIPLAITSEEFVELWKASSASPSEETYSAFLKALYPYVRFWSKQLKETGPKHIAYVSLLQLLAASKSKLTPQAQIRNWLCYVSSYSSLEEELLDLLYKQILDFKFISISYNNHKVLEWTWAEAFKRSLKDKIKNKSFTKVPDFEYSPDWDSILTIEMNIADILLIKNLLQKQEHKAIIKSLLDLDNKIVSTRYRKEYKKLCRLIKTKS